MTEHPDADPALDLVETVDPERRSFLRKAAGMGFVIPVVATFSMSGMMAGPAYAYGNLSP